MAGAAVMFQKMQDFSLTLNVRLVRDGKHWHESNG